MRVLIAEDEKQTAKALKLMLEKNKFAVDIVFDGIAAWKYVNQVSYDVVVLDIMMPGLNGLEVLRKIREASMTVPVMLLTARSEIEDRVEGLEAGADDYLPKPFAFAEFIARVKALSRRNGSYLSSTLQFGNIQLDVNSYCMVSGDDRILLNNKEFQLFELFMRHPGHVFSTRHLMDQIWGMDSESNIDVVWTHIGFLRKKLKKMDADIEIHTVRGVGYMLNIKKDNAKDNV